MKRSYRATLLHRSQDLSAMPLPLSSALRSRSGQPAPTGGTVLPRLARYVAPLPLGLEEPAGGKRCPPFDHAQDRWFCRKLWMRTSEIVTFCYLRRVLSSCREKSRVDHLRTSLLNIVRLPSGRSSPLVMSQKPDHGTGDNEE